MKDILDFSAKGNERIKMENFVFMLKTYSGDFIFLDRLLKSYVKFNKDAIKLFMCVPKEDFKAAQVYEKYMGVHVIDESTIPIEFADKEIKGMRPGYINQEIVKLSFWKLGIAQNYLCIDSDAEFIRDFFYSEFMYDDNIPYTALIEDNDLHSDEIYWNLCGWEHRENEIRAIGKEINYSQKHMLTCHGFQVLNAKVLQNLEEKYMIPNKLSYLDLMEKHGYEFSWYNMWLQKTECIPIKICEPWFKTYHTPMQLIKDVCFGTTTQALKRAYVGVVVNSNMYDSREHILNLDDFGDYLIATDKVIYQCLKKSSKMIRKIIFKSSIFHIKCYVKNMVMRMKKELQHGR